MVVDDGTLEVSAQLSEELEDIAMPCAVDVVEDKSYGLAELGSVATPCAVDVVEGRKDG